MAKQPEALRLADVLDAADVDPFSSLDVEKAAAELRRLHEANSELLTALKVLLNNNEALTGENIARAAAIRARGQA